VAVKERQLIAVTRRTRSARRLGHFLRSSSGRPFFCDEEIIMVFTDVISQPAYPGANPKTIAEILVLPSKYTSSAGGVFSGWETVWIQHRWKEGEPKFRFTARLSAIRRRGSFGQRFRSCRRTRSSSSSAASSRSLAS
jgi:hypothetical protein